MPSEGHPLGRADRKSLTSLRTSVVVLLSTGGASSAPVGWDSCSLNGLASGAPASLGSVAEALRKVGRRVVRCVAVLCFDDSHDNRGLHSLLQRDASSDAGLLICLLVCSSVHFSHSYRVGSGVSVGPTYGSTPSYINPTVLSRCDSLEEGDPPALLERVTTQRQRHESRRHEATEHEATEHDARRVEATRVEGRRVEATHDNDNDSPSNNDNERATRSTHDNDSPSGTTTSLTFEGCRGETTREGPTSPRWRAEREESLHWPSRLGKTMMT